MSSRSPGRGLPGRWRRAARSQPWHSVPSRGGNRVSSASGRSSTIVSSDVARPFAGPPLWCLRRPLLARAACELMSRLPGSTRRIVALLNAPLPFHGSELTMPATIVGIGTALPTHRINQSDAAEIARAFSCETKEQERSSRRSSASRAWRRRHSVDPRGHRTGTWTAVNRSMARPIRRRTSGCSNTRPMRAPSPRRRPAGPSKRPGSSRDALTHLVTVSCSGFSAPGVDHALIRRLGLSPASSRAPTSASWDATACSTACGSRVRSSRPIRRRASCSARSSCAACTSSTAGMPNAWWPTPSSPTGPPRW